MDTFSQKTIEQFKGYSVFDPDEAPRDVDYIFVANTYSDDIKEICISKGIDLSRVVFCTKGKLRNGLILKILR